MGDRVYVEIEPIPLEPELPPPPKQTVIVLDLSPEDDNVIKL